MNIVEIIKKCDTWSNATEEDDRHYVKVWFNTEKDAKAFAVELMMVTSGQDPYGEAA